MTAILTGRESRTGTSTEGRPSEDMGKMAIYSPKIEASEETNPADTLIFNLQFLKV